MPSAQPSTHMRSWGHLNPPTCSTLCHPPKKQREPCWLGDSFIPTISHARGTQSAVSMACTHSIPLSNYPISPHHLTPPGLPQPGLHPKLLHLQHDTELALQ